MKRYTYTHYKLPMTIFCQFRGFDAFEVSAKLAQRCLLCAPLGIHLEPINKALMLLVII